MFSVHEGYGHSLETQHSLIVLNGSGGGGYEDAVDDVVEDEG